VSEATAVRGRPYTSPTSILGVNLEVPPPASLARNSGGWAIGTAAAQRLVNHRKEPAVKNLLRLAIVISGLAVPMVASADGVGELRKDIAADKKDIRKDEKELHADVKDIRQDRKELGVERKQLKEDIKDGDKKAAEKLAGEMATQEKDLHADVKDARADRKDIRADEKELRQDRRDLRQDRRELREDHHEHR
jgi:hypothetical protein